MFNVLKLIKFLILHIFSSFPYRGRHGIVRRVVDKVSGKQFAAKMVHVCEAPQKHFFRHELETMRLLSHKNVPTIADAFQTDRRLAVVMELYPGCHGMFKCMLIEVRMNVNIMQCIEKKKREILH